MGNLGETIRADEHLCNNLKHFSEPTFYFLALPLANITQQHIIWPLSISLKDV